MSADINDGLAEKKIVLVRHARSAHLVKGLLDRDAFLRWREAYEAAGIDPADLPPGELIAEAAKAAVIVSSDVRRAMESAHLLAPGCEVIASPLLRELALHPRKLKGIRLPLFGWALTYAFRRLATPEERQRAGEAARWLVELSAQHGAVIAVTHGSFRSLVARELAKHGWVPVKPRRGRMRHWSAWSFSP